MRASGETCSFAQRRLPVRRCLLPVAWLLAAWLLVGPSAAAQTQAPPSYALEGVETQSSEIKQVAEILGMTERLRTLQDLQGYAACNAAATLPELTLRQSLLESIEGSELDVESAVAEIDNERGELGNLQTALRSSRDKTVAKLNAAALITGSGIGAAVSVSQFTSLGSRTNNVGDSVGIGSGATSTLLAYLAVRKAHGPEQSVAEVPNMLAPLFDRPAVLNTHYPAVVLQYLKSVPPGQAGRHGTRLEQLKAEWAEAGRLDSTDAAKEEKKIVVLTTSGEKDVKISIGDLTDRIAMLGDVSGRISLMKRDLALLLRSYKRMDVCPAH